MSIIFFYLTFNIYSKYSRISLKMSVQKQSEWVYKDVSFRRVLFNVAIFFSELVFLTALILIYTQFVLEFHEEQNYAGTTLVNHAILLPKPCFGSRDASDAASNIQPAEWVILATMDLLHYQLERVAQRCRTPYSKKMLSLCGIQSMTRMSPVAIARYI